jgi:hypothetical protein
MLRAQCERVLLGTFRESGTRAPRLTLRARRQLVKCRPLMHFGLEVEAFLPCTPPFLHDSGQRAPIVEQLASHMRRMPLAARFQRPDPPGLDVQSASNVEAAVAYQAAVAGAHECGHPPMPTEVRYFSYSASKSDESYDTWKITTDASIRGDRGESVGGLEFITPKLPFTTAGLLACRHFVQGVGIGGFVTNDSTAVHVHVSCTDLSNREVQRFASYLVAFEHVIDLYLTHRRRGDSCRYVRSNLWTVAPHTRSWTDAVHAIEALDLRETLNPLVQMMNMKLAPAYNSERNHKVNFTLLRNSVLGQGSRRVEFRQLHGTTDAYVCSDWATLCCKFVRNTSRLSESPLDIAARLELLAVGQDYLGVALPEAAFWSIIADEFLEKRFAFHAKVADASPKEFAVEGRELFASQEDAYADMNEITEVVVYRCRDGGSEKA